MQEDQPVYSDSRNMTEAEEERRLPDHPVHDQDVPQKSHHADDGVQSRDGDGDGDPRGAAPRNLLPAGVLQPPRRLFIQECDVEGDDGVKVGQGELRPRHRDRLHDAAARSAEAELLRGEATPRLQLGGKV